MARMLVECLIFLTCCGGTATFEQELDLLEDDAPVFKLIGPVLMKQDLEESKQNVAKRLELIEREMYVICSVSIVVLLFSWPELVDGGHLMSRI